MMRAGPYCFSCVYITSADLGQRFYGNTIIHTILLDVKIVQALVSIVYLLVRRRCDIISTKWEINNADFLSLVHIIQKKCAVVNTKKLSWKENAKKC